MLQLMNHLSLSMAVNPGHIPRSLISIINDIVECIAYSIAMPIKVRTLMLNLKIHYMYTILNKIILFKNQATSLHRNCSALPIYCYFNFFPAALPDPLEPALLNRESLLSSLDDLLKTVFVIFVI